MNRWISRDSQSFRGNFQQLIDRASERQLQNANREIGCCRVRGRQHSQLVQFSCCVEPHNCAFCCTLSLSPLDSSFTRDFIALLFSCQCSTVKTSNFLLKASNEIVEQGESKYNQNFLVIFLLSRNNYNALKCFQFLFSVGAVRRERWRDEKKGFEGNSYGKGI